MPTNRRPSTPGASPRPGGGRSGGGSRGDGRSSTSRARGTSGPTTSRSDAGTSGRSGAGSGASKAGPAKGASKDASAAKASGPATGAGRKPAVPRKPSTTSAAGAGAGSGTGGRSTASTSRASSSPRTPRPSTSTRAPALADRRRSRNGFLLPEVVTVRSLVIAVVVLLAVILLLPTLRAYVNQTGELRALRAEVAAAEAEREDLQVQLGRWDDDAYVIAQARDRLSYVMPGERAWRVIDPEIVVDDLDPETGRKVTEGPVGVEGNDGAPWYTSLWRSVQLAGEQPAPGDAPADLGGDEPPATDATTP
ncbi:septum formation initiator family protein [Oerskovia sp. NPDC056781]|uniref:FtsB family cell division protein n=1 Tax=Oerskovia sp. NPDC056781 TaxID=3345942 RepID=UPI00366AA899